MVSKVTTVKCDWCGILKGDTNHWWKIGRDTTKKILLIAPAGEGIEGGDFCGNKCVMSEVEAFLGSKK